MMTSVSNGIIQAINEAYSKMNYDINITMQSQGQDKVKKNINRYSNRGEIKKVIPLINFKAKLNNDDAKQLTMVGVDSEKYINFEDYMYYTDKKKQLEEVNKEKGIIIAKQVAEMYNLSIGETISVVYGNKKAKLKILSILDARMYSDGNYNIISKRVAERLFGIDNPSEYYMKATGNLDQTMNQLMRELEGSGSAVYSKEELVKN